MTSHPGPAQPLHHDPADITADTIAEGLLNHLAVESAQRLYEASDRDRFFALASPAPGFFGGIASNFELAPRELRARGRESAGEGVISRNRSAPRGCGFALVPSKKIQY